MTIQNLGVRDGYSNLGVPRLPRLREVTLIDHSEEVNPPFFCDDDFASVKKLTFITTCGWLDYDVTCIRRFRSIRVLILKNDGFYDNHIGAHDPSSLMPAELSLLETLTLSGKVSHRILDKIRAPGLRKMEIEADGAHGRHSLVASHLVHMVGLLERLCVSFNKDMHETSWVEELERLIAEAPPLVSVWVSPWMARCVIGKEWCFKLHVTDPK